MIQLYVTHLNDNVVEVSSRDEANLARSFKPWQHEYVFWWRGDEKEGEEFFSTVLKRVHQQVNSDATWLSLWSSDSTKPDYDFRIRSLWLSGKKKKSGWDVGQTGQVFSAIKQIGKDELTYIPPKPSGGFVSLLFGDVNELNKNLISVRSNVARLAIWESFHELKEMIELYDRTRSKVLAHASGNEIGWLCLELFTADALELNELLSGHGVEIIRTESLQWLFSCKIRAVDKGTACAFCHDILGKIPTT